MFRVLRLEELYELRVFGFGLAFRVEGLGLGLKWEYSDFGLKAWFTRCLME